MHMDLLVISKCTGLTIDILEQGANFEDLSHAAHILVTDNPPKRDVPRLPQMIYRN